MLFGRMYLDCISRFSVVGVDADDGDAARAVVLREFLHALVVSVRYGTLHRDEDEHRTVLSFERVQRVFFAISIRQLKVLDGSANRRRHERRIVASPPTAGNYSAHQNQKCREQKGESVLPFHQQKTPFKRVSVMY